MLAGFCLFYRSPNTEYTFDIHTFVVGRDYRSKAVGPRLVELLEERISSQVPYAVMRIETSKIKETAIGAGFFESVGFQTIGHIPGFYETDNDYYIYVRAVSAARQETAKRESARLESSAAGSVDPVDEASGL